MFFFALLIFAALVPFLPWWGFLVVGVLWGVFSPGGTWRDFKVASGAFVSSVAWAFVYDGQMHSLVSKRMSGLFALPTPLLFLIVVGAIMGVSAFLGLRSGTTLSRLAKR